MKAVTAKIKPASGFSHFFHVILTALFPLLLFIFIRLDFFSLAVALVVLSKWRMFAVKPRHWPANIRANAVDLIVGLSIVVFMSNAGSQSIQAGWAVMYALWLIYVKPKSTFFGVTIQALVAQFAGLTALFINWGDSSIAVLVILAWLVCYSAARHFFTTFDEPLTRFLSDVWAYFGAALTWVLSHWLLFYGVVAQPTLILTVLGFGLSGIYYLDQEDRLSAHLKRQIVFIMIAIIVIVITFSDWGNKAV